MDFLRAGPALESYIPLSEHQSSTPSSFFIGPPVLYYHCKSATLSARSSDLPKSDAVKQFCDHARTRYTINEGALDGSEEEIAIKDVEIVVASQWVYLHYLGEFADERLGKRQIDADTVLSQFSNFFSSQH